MICGREDKSQPTKEEGRESIQRHEFLRAAEPMSATTQLRSLVKNQTNKPKKKNPAF